MITAQFDRYISQVILKRVERHYDVGGAPFKIGQKVIVLDNPNGDETFDRRFAGRHAKVIFFEFDGGCGQSFPFDPMIGVMFNDKSVEEFWYEELRSIP